MLRRKAVDQLTPREREVLRLVRLGLTNEEIAARLGISLAGVKYHVSEILSKLGVASREEAAALVQEEQRPWWAALPLAAKAAGAALLVASVAGVGVLIWAVVETGGAGERPAPASIGSYDDPYDYRSFLRDIGRAVENADLQWFLDNAAFQPFPCDQGGMPARPESCEGAAEGSSIPAIIIGIRQSEGYAADRAEYERFLREFLTEFDAAASDEYGDGAPRPYAWGIRSTEFGKDTAAVATATAIATRVLVIPETTTPPGNILTARRVPAVPGRSVLLIDGLFDGSRWAISGLTFGGGALDPDTVAQMLDPGGRGAPGGVRLWEFWSPWEMEGADSQAALWPELAWESPDSVEVATSTTAGCGDVTTAAKYQVPPALAVVQPRGRSLLGLEAEPYDYVPAQVETFGEWQGQPSGWEMYQRYVLNARAHPNRMAISEVFLRSPDNPSLLFRYDSQLCDQPDGPPASSSAPRPALPLLPDEPHIEVHRQGDYLSAEEVLGRLPERAPGVRPVWLSLGGAEEVAQAVGLDSYPTFTVPDRVLWVVVEALGDNWGPKRAGHEWGSYQFFDAVTGSPEVWGCCIDLIRALRCLALPCRQGPRPDRLELASHTRTERAHVQPQLSHRRPARRRHRPRGRPRRAEGPRRRRAQDRPPLRPPALRPRRRALPEYGRGPRGLRAR